MIEGILSMMAMQLGSVYIFCGWKAYDFFVRAKALVISSCRMCNLSAWCRDSVILREQEPSSSNRGSDSPAWFSFDFYWGCSIEYIIACLMGQINLMQR